MQSFGELMGELPIGWRHFLHSILLPIDCLPASIAIGKDIGEDRSIHILRMLVARYDDTVDDSNVAIESDTQIVKALFEVSGRQILRRVIDVLGLGEEVACRHGMHKIRSENAFEGSSVMLSIQP